MKCVLLFFLFVVILEVATAQTSQVQELSDGNFLEMVTGHPLVLVEFYSPTCPFSQKIAPEYEKAATALKDSPSGVVLAKVDCTNSLSNITCTKTKVRFVPWIVLFRNGAQVANFENRSRDAATIVKFVTEANNDKHLSNTQQDLTIPKIQPNNTCDDRQAPAQVANQTAEAPELNRVGPAVTMLTDATFTGFLKSSSYVIVDYYTPWCSDCQHLSPLYEDAAAHLRKDKMPIKFAKVDCNQGNTATSTICGASKLKFYPWIVLYHNGDFVSNFERENVADTATIYKFINSGAHFDDLPSISTSVKEVDDSSFDKMLTDHPFVLVEFYAPWCFYCKKLTPIYEDIATGLTTSQPDVRLVTVDCTATNTKTKNTCTKNDIAFLPTLKLFQNGKFAKEYEGDKTKKDSILNFINDEISKQATKREKLSENKKEKPSDEDKEGSTPDDKKLDEKDTESPKNKTVVKKTEKKEKKTKKNDQTEKKKENINKAAQILKTVFKQFKKKRHQKSKHRNYDDDDEDDDEGHHDHMKQVAKDIHQIASDIHKMYKDVHKAQKKQPAVDRLMKAFHRLVKNKDEDEDDL